MINLAQCGDLVAFSAGNSNGWRSKRQLFLIFLRWLIYLLNSVDKTKFKVKGMGRVSLVSSLPIRNGFANGEN